MKSLLVIVFVSVLSCLASGQKTEIDSIQNLVFEGAGIKGVAYVGVLRELETMGITERIEKVAGTSAGAIVAMMFSLGYTSAELDSILGNMNMARLNDGRILMSGGMIRLFNNYGWDRNDEALQWIEELVSLKTGTSETTLLEHHEAGFPDLYTTATCLNKQKLVFLSHETYPNMRVADAVLISMSIPLYFGVVYVDNNGKTYKRQHKEGSYDIMFDGGLIGNYPIQIFDTVVNGAVQPNPQTIGIMMEMEEQIAQNDHALVPQQIQKMKQYVSAFYRLVLESLNTQNLSQADWERTIQVSSKGIGPRIRRLKQSEKEMLVGSGIQACRRYFL